MCTNVHIYFSLSTMTTFLTCYTSTLVSPIPLDLFQLSYNLWKNYISIFTFHIYITPHILHSMLSLVARSISEPKYDTLETNYEFKILKKDKLPISGFLLQGQWGGQFSLAVSSRALDIDLMLPRFYHIVSLIPWCCLNLILLEGSYIDLVVCYPTVLEHP
jgi:hypothetical protein